MCACLFIDAVWSAAGKGLTSWLSLCLIVKLSLSIGILGQVWCLIVLIPDLCLFSYFHCDTEFANSNKMYQVNGRIRNL